MRAAKRNVRVSPKDVVAALAPPPRWIEPQLCKLVSKIPTGDGWAHEIKFDGYRMSARIVGGAASLLTRTGLDWTAKYPEIAAASGALECRQAYVDGELCAVVPDGTTSFAALQGHGDAPADLVYFAFDVLHLDGEDLMGLPLLERKARLEVLLAKPPSTVRYSEHWVGNGVRVFEEATKFGLEGIVSKQVDKPYVPGNRGIWVKTKCLNRKEFVVVGWTDSEGSRPHLGALLLGYYSDDGKLVYAGRVGTGMPDKVLADLRRKLEPLARTSTSLAEPPPRKTRFGSPLILSRVHWVEPKLVAEVTYVTWTGDGLLRHTVFMGFRSDKPAEQVRREFPK